MKLGKETGSIFNSIYGENTRGPVVGEGATVLHWTDRSAYFVDKVSADGKECVIVRAKAIPQFQGMTDSQYYTYERDKNASPVKLRFRYGSWFVKSFCPEENKTNYFKIRISFGHMTEYYDYSF